MITKIFTIWDAKSESYGQPFSRLTKGIAIRDFGDDVNRSDNHISKHPEDYSLFEIGEYDDSTATYTNLENKVPLGSAMEYKKTE